jgi:hypothetical protein
VNGYDREEQMSLYNHGNVTYPGINAVESFEFTDISGVQPAIGTMKVFPQYGLPDEDGDLVMTYNDQTITIQAAHIDSVQYEVGGGGQIVDVRFMDSRWKWVHRFITGRYNIRLPNNWIDPDHEQSPQQLATLLFQALGESMFDVSDLPNDSRPDCDWDHTSASQELDKLCNDLGCRVVPVRSTQSWKIVVTGDGADLPTFPSQDVGQGIDPQEVPDFIKIVTAPIRYQMQLPLRAVGKDTDLSWKPLRQLSYAPLSYDILIKASTRTPQTVTSGGFGQTDWAEFRWLDSNRFVMPDGTKVSVQELARDTIFSSYRIEFENAPGAKQDSHGNWGYPVPTIDKPVTRKQIILSNELAQMWTDNLGALHQRPAYITGVFYGKLCEGVLANFPLGTRIDKQADKSDTGEDERASFSLSLDPLDTDRSIISVSPKLLQQIYPTLVSYNTVEAGKSVSKRVSIEWVEAKLSFTNAFQVRDPDTWQPLRYEFLMQIGNGSDKDFAYTVIRDDIRPTVIVQSDVNGLPAGYTTNYDEVVDQCQYYAQSLARKFQTVTSERATFIGLFPIDMDGAICQVTYSINKGGASTIASQGTEHSYITPDYEERRQMTARQGMAEKIQYVKYETARRNAYLGNVNT